MLQLGAILLLPVTFPGRLHKPGCKKKKVWGLGVQGSSKKGLRDAQGSGLRMSDFADFGGRAGLMGPSVRSDKKLKCSVSSPTSSTPYPVVLD